MSTSQETIDKNTDTEAGLKARAISLRKIYDRIAAWVVTAGGMAIIGSIIAILVFIGGVTLPLWKSASYDLVSAFNVEPQSTENPKVISVGTDEHREYAFVVFDNGKMEFVSLKDGTVVKETFLTNTAPLVITSSYVAGINRLFAFSTDNGLIYPVEVSYEVTYDIMDDRLADTVDDQELAEELGEAAQAGLPDDRITDLKRIITPDVEIKDPIVLREGSISRFAYKSDRTGDSVTVAALYDTGELILYSSVKETRLLGPFEVKENIADLTDDLGGRTLTDIQVDGSQRFMYASTTRGKILEWDIRNKENPVLRYVLDATGDRSVPVTALGFLIGDRSLIVGDGDGNVSIWFHVRDEAGIRNLTRIHDLPTMESAVNQFRHSSRDRGFLASDEKGNIALYYSTTQLKRLEIPGNDISNSALTFSPRTDGITVVDIDGNLRSWRISNPHPEATLKALFGKVWYEGYDEPAYVWQSTGGEDTFERKLGLTPLVYGSIKGAIYAMIFAIPLAIFAAICVSQFMHPTFRGYIKPVIEIMAALPSVVLGFLAGLWMAPRLEQYFPMFIILPIVVSILALGTLLLWKMLPKRITGRVKVGGELLLLFPAVMAACVIAYWLNFPTEYVLFGGDFKVWFYDVLGLQYDQRNALVVGFAMGFAVIPIIFTISEDALSSVPRELTAGSLALGANRWQTALKIVLPTASPGIFSAVMIGFGRAVGETMIVLMATGNTPIMDWSFFNGFRALSANIAVELPEASHGGTLYRVLFLSALLLFMLTFVINTVAEVIRLRLRKKYGQV